MKGTLVNFAAILVGSGIGLLLKKGIPERYQHTLIHGMALAVGIIGLQMAFKSQNMLVVILGIAVGAVIGELVDLDACLTRIGDKLTIAFKGKQGNVGEGFVTASLIFCIGAMAIVGSIQDGLTGNAETLYAKSMLDGIIAMVFSSSMGIGVAFSSLSVLLYQGSITLLSGLLAGWLSENVVREMTATGGILIVGVSIIMLEVKKIKLANLLPAIPMAALIAYFWPG